MSSCERIGPRGRIAWITSDYCTQGGNCVEVLRIGAGVGVRDSKEPDGPVLGFTREEWAAFLAGAKDGQFDHLAQGA